MDSIFWIYTILILLYQQNIFRDLPNFFLARVLRGRYYNPSSPLKDRKVYSPSYGWHSIIAVYPFLKSGLRKTTRTCKNTCVWAEPWIPNIEARPPRASDRVIYRHQKLLVHSFIRRDPRD